MNPNNKDGNLDPYDGPGNIDMSSITYNPEDLNAYGDVDNIPSSAITMVSSVASLSSGGAYQCILQVAIPAGKPSGRDYVGNFDVTSGSVSDDFRLKVTTVEPGGSVTGTFAFWGKPDYDGNHLFWTSFGMDEVGYNLYRCDEQDPTFSRLNPVMLHDRKYQDELVSFGMTYQYKLGIKLNDHEELLIGPLVMRAIGGSDMPERFGFKECYPNPFSHRAIITYEVPFLTGDIKQVTLQVYDLSGRMVRLVDKRDYAPGYYTVAWDRRDRFGREVSDGIYFLRLAAGGYRATTKMTVIK